MPSSAASNQMRVGIGGWTFAPWRGGTFYPQGLAQAKELSYAAAHLTSIEINATYYSRFAPATWSKWRDATPDGFQFAVKASRFCTNRKVLAEAGPAVERFLGQGLTELNDRLGPINWQMMPTKAFDPDDMQAFLDLLPAKLGKLALRHAIEVTHQSFDTPQFFDMARRRKVAIVMTTSERAHTIDEATAPFTYARFKVTQEAKGTTGIDSRQLGDIAKRVRKWAERGDVFAYFIGAAKAYNPAAATALMERLAAVRAAAKAK